MKSKDGAAVLNGQPLGNEVREWSWMSLEKEKRKIRYTSGTYCHDYFYRRAIRLSVTQCAIPGSTEDLHQCSPSLTLTHLLQSKFTGFFLPVALFLSLGTAIQVETKVPFLLLTLHSAPPFLSISLPQLWPTSSPAWTFRRAPKEAFSLLHLPLCSLSLVTHSF